jgi:hypothetical protein
MLAFTCQQSSRISTLKLRHQTNSAPMAFENLMAANALHQVAGQSQIPHRFLSG